MPSSNLAAYLAKNYLTASTSASQSDTHGATSSDFQESSRPKKKRRKNKDSALHDGGGGLIVADDDEDLSLRGLSARRRRDNQDGEGDGDIPTMESGVKSAEFRKKKGGSGWKVVATTDAAAADAGAGDAGDDDDDQEAADRILAEAAEESRLRRREFENEDAPTVVDNGAADLPRMSSGARGGLQTAADTAALIEQEQRDQERERARKSKTKSKRQKETEPEEEEEPEQETIYRDATGRRIDISLRRAEARAAEEAKKRAEKLAAEQAMGDVQRREKEERKQQLEEARFLTLARGADDEEMNDHLRSVQRWDDPMARYMAERAAEEEAEAGASVSVSAGAGTVARTKTSTKQTPSSTTKTTRKKIYQGPPPAPNRYGIAPGFRWDGVDRSTGFEKEWFQARAQKGRNEELRYQWQTDE